MRVFYDCEPESVKYMPLPNGKADVWIRKDIKRVDNDEGGYWQAEEVYLRTAQSKQEVESNVDMIFYKESGIAEKLTAIVQEYLDKTVQSRNYDNIASACSYANSTDPIFAAEGKACVAWRDCYQIQDNVIKGLSGIPTADELISNLPVLEW